MASLSLPANISKLSIEWQYGASNYPACKFDTGSEMESESLSFMLEAASKWVNLKTLTLRRSNNHQEKIRHTANLRQLVLRLVSQLEHLNCLNLVGQFESEIIETIEKAVDDATRLSRPRFRFFMGAECQYLSHDWRVDARMSWNENKSAQHDKQSRDVLIWWTCLFPLNELILTGGKMLIGD